MRIGRNQARLLRWISSQEGSVREPFRIQGFTHSKTRAMWNGLVRCGAIVVWDGVVEKVSPRALAAAKEFWVEN